MRRFHWGMAGREARWNLQTGFTIWKAFESAALTDALSSMMTKDDIFFHFNDDKTTLPQCHLQMPRKTDEGKNRGIIRIVP